MRHVNAVVPQPRGAAGAHLPRPREAGALWGIMSALLLPTILATLANTAVRDADGLGSVVWILALIGELALCTVAAIALAIGRSGLAGGLKSLVFDDQ